MGLGQAPPTYALANAVQAAQCPLRCTAAESRARTDHYNANHGGTVPVATAVVTIPLSERWAVDPIAIPRAANDTYATLNLSLSWRFR